MRTPATRQHWISRDKHMCSPTFQKLTFCYRRAFISSVWWRIHSRSQLLWSTISRLYDSFSVRPISYRVLVWPVSTRVSMTFSSWVSEQETKKKTTGRDMIMGVQPKNCAHLGLIWMFGLLFCALLVHAKTHVSADPQVVCHFCDVALVCGDFFLRTCTGKRNK